MNRKEAMTFDLRDGKAYAAHQGNSRKLVNVPWFWPERSISGFHGTHEKAMRDLLRNCKKDGQTVYAAFLHNYAVSVILKGE